MTCYYDSAHHNFWYQPFEFVSLNLVYSAVLNYKIVAFYFLPDFKYS